jgi:hypothetical protein
MFVTFFLSFLAFSCLMSRRYADAAKFLVPALWKIAKLKVRFFLSFFLSYLLSFFLSSYLFISFSMFFFVQSQVVQSRSHSIDAIISTKSDKLFALLAVNVSLYPHSIDKDVLMELQERFRDKIQKMQKG